MPSHIYLIKKSPEHGGFAIFSYPIIEEKEKAWIVKGKKQFTAAKSRSIVDLDVAKAQLAETANASIAEREADIAKLKAYLANPTVLNGLDSAE